MKSIAALSLVLASNLSIASFVDSFDGNTLASHWDLFSEYGNNWDATVSDGQLHVNGFYPNDWNHIRIDAYFPEIGLSDFDASVAFVLEANTPRSFTWALMQQGGFNLRTFSGGAQFYCYDSDANRHYLPALEPGRHVLSMSRINQHTSYFVNGVWVASIANSITWTQRTVLAFEGPYTGWSPIHVDYVFVSVPEPSSLAMIGIATTVMIWRKKKNAKRMGSTHRG